MVFSIVMLLQSSNNLNFSGKSSQESSFESQKLKNYVESCLKKTSEESMTLLSNHGGVFSPSSDIDLDGIELNILAEYGSGFGYTNKMLRLDNIESELALDIKNNLKSCIVWDSFMKEGYSIKDAAMQIQVVINSEKTEIFLNYPVELSKSDLSLKPETFSANTQLPFFKIYSAAMDIVNQEASFGFFDKEQYMLEQSPNLMIEKYRPYPDIVYSLKEIDPVLNKELIFNFAIKGKETANREILVYKQKGCCTDNHGIYFRNVDQSQCSAPYTYKNKEECSSNNNRLPIVTGCCFRSNSCGLTNEQNCISSGGQFTENDLLCANYSCPNLKCRNVYDIGQGQFLSNSILNGQSWCGYDSMAGKGLDYVGTRHYLHSCINGVEYIEPCRDYREELCTQDTIQAEGKSFPKAMCRINRWYDCSQQTDQANCMDTSKRDCYWSDYFDIEKKCYPYVPPGLKFWEGNNNICNIANFEKGSYGNDYPKTWGHTTLAYCQRTGDCGNYRSISDDIGMGGYYNPDGSPEPWIYWSPGYVGRGSEFFIDLGTNNTYTAASSIPFGTSAGYARCNLWQPAATDKCELCVDSKERPCTEYKCRSLGPGCVFDKATNHCGETSSSDSIAPIIHLIEIQPGFDFTAQPSMYYQDTIEYAVSPNILVHNSFNFKFSTTELTRCKLSLLPPQGYSLNNLVTDVMLNSYDYLDLYNITIRFPSSTLTNFNNYQLFIKCNDQSGNTNQNEFLLNIFTSELNDDTISPEIISVVPENQQVQAGTSVNFDIFVNEPFNSCRYSNESINFNSMTPLNCQPTNEENIIYHISYPLGAYLCSSVIDIPLESIELFFACEDKKGNVNNNFIYQI